MTESFVYYLYMKERAEVYKSALKVFFWLAYTLHAALTKMLFTLEHFKSIIWKEIRPEEVLIWLHN